MQANSRFTVRECDLRGQFITDDGDYLEHTIVAEDFHQAKKLAQVIALQRGNDVYVFRFGNAPRNGSSEYAIMLHDEPSYSQI